jgi:hypothetical protein
VRAERVAQAADRREIRRRERHDTRGSDAPRERRAGDRGHELALDGRRQSRDVGEDVAMRRFGHGRRRPARRRGVDLPQQRRRDPPDRHPVRHRVVDPEHERVPADEVDRPERAVAVEALLHELGDGGLQRRGLGVLADVLVEVEPHVGRPRQPVAVLRQPVPETWDAVEPAGDVVA